MELKTHRFTVEEYESLADNPVFSSLRTELIDGQIVEMTPKNDTHAHVLSLLNQFFSKRLPDELLVRLQDPIVISDFTEPEPDLVIRRQSGPNRGRHPRPEDILLLVEVAESSLSYDRGRRADLSASAGIVEYWIVNLVEPAIEVHRDPQDGAYQQIYSVTAGSVTTLMLPNLSLGLSTLFPEDEE